MMISTIARALARPAAGSRGALSLASVNPHVVEAQYAVRGELVLRAGELEKRLRAGDKTLPFDKIVYCNIGNPQELGQRPISFHRQVLALCDYPELIDQSNLPPDVRVRARKYLGAIPAGTGAYSHSKGVAIVRQEVADFIERRDGVEVDPEHVFLTDGASPGVQNCLKLMITGPGDGIMCPLPQYPLYSASISLLGGSFVGYYLDEANGWSLDIAELERSYAEAQGRGVTPKALCLINPGNPTGQVLSLDNIRDVISFCHAKDLVIMADEVYQENIYGDRPFVSFRKALAGMDQRVIDEVALISFHSVSKGFLGECGRRGGYMECHGVAEEVLAQLYKLQSVSLCPNLGGQLMVGLMVNPPVVGDESYDQYHREVSGILGSLKRRANKLSIALNAMEGVSCQHVEGAMYAFPTITLPPGAVAAAKDAGKTPDTFYCLEVLANTGIVIVPGSGFGQREGTFHFRTTFLPSEDDIDTVIKRLSDFHAEFLARY